MQKNRERKSGIDEKNKEVAKRMIRKITPHSYNGFWWGGEASQD